jgi:hypothetical protein
MNKQMTKDKVLTKDQVRALKKGRLYFVRFFMWLEVKISLIEVMRCRELLQKNGVFITSTKFRTQADILARAYGLYNPEPPYETTD